MERYVVQNSFNIIITKLNSGYLVETNAGVGVAGEQHAAESVASVVELVARLLGEIDSGNNDE